MPLFETGALKKKSYQQGFYLGKEADRAILEILKHRTACQFKFPSDKTLRVEYDANKRIFRPVSLDDWDRSGFVFDEKLQCNHEGDNDDGVAVFVFSAASVPVPDAPADGEDDEEEEDEDEDDEEGEDDDEDEDDYDEQDEDYEDEDEEVEKLAAEKDEAEVEKLAAEKDEAEVEKLAEAKLAEKDGDLEAAKREAAAKEVVSEAPSYRNMPLESLPLKKRILRLLQRGCL